MHNPMHAPGNRTHWKCADKARGRGRFTFSYVHATNAFFLSSGVYAVFAIFYFLLSEASYDGLRLALIHAGSAVSLFTYWKLGRWGNARFDSFGAALLLIAILLRILAVTDAMFYGTRTGQLPQTVQYPESMMGLLFKGEAITHFGLLLVVSAWRVLVSDKIEDFSFLHNYRTVSKQLSWMVYVSALSIEVGRRLLSADFGALTQISSLTYAFGVVSIFFIAARNKRLSGRISVALLLALPMVALALGSGMKENIFFPLMPAAILYWFGFRGLAPKIIAIVGGVLLLAFAQLYVGYVRDTAWGSDRKFTTMELIVGFQEYFAQSNIADGLESISARINMTTTHAITVAIADSRGFEPFETFGSIPASLIPRFLWPSKPVFQPGAVHTARIYNLQVPPSEISTATAAGIFSELYLGGGYIGYIAGALFLGLLLGHSQLWSLKNSPGFGHLAFCFVSAYWALRFDEKAVVYAYTSIVFTLVFLILLSKASALARLNQKISRST